MTPASKLPSASVRTVLVRPSRDVTTTSAAGNHGAGNIDDGADGVAHSQAGTAGEATVWARAGIASQSVATRRRPACRIIKVDSTLYVIVSEPDRVPARRSAFTLPANCSCWRAPDATSSAAFRALHFVGPCVTVFGSARFDEHHRYYAMAREVGGALVGARLHGDDRRRAGRDGRRPIAGRARPADDRSAATSNCPSNRRPTPISIAG